MAFVALQSQGPLGSMFMMVWTKKYSYSLVIPSPLYFPSSEMKLEVERLVL
jgi:hypothetical protein